MTSPSSTSRQRHGAAFVGVGVCARRRTQEARSTTTDDDFDPFLQSPLSFVSSSSSSSFEDYDRADEKRNFGFLTYDECNVGASADAATSATTDEFDPLLSPHDYVNGVDAAIVGMVTAKEVTPTSPRRLRQKKVGILLIDHGSKRPASNEHIHMVAGMYERILNDRDRATGGGVGGATAMTTIAVVRAAHMEIAPPSILDSLRGVLADDGVSEVVCVPYFLSPGRHATEDVPNLIEEARDILGREGLLSSRLSRRRATGSVADVDDDYEEEEEYVDDDDVEIQILVSDALGTHLGGMLGVVDDLVERTLNK
jgi:sirohydrochlorin ferrochelatase